jgi:hypothetical protein
MKSAVRLASVAPDLVELSRSLHPKKRKEIARLTAKWACDRTGVSVEPYVARLFDDAYSPVRQDREALAEYIANYDDRYFSIAERDNSIDVNGAAMCYGLARLDPWLHCCTRSTAKACQTFAKRYTKHWLLQTIWPAYERYGLASRKILRHIKQGLPAPNSMPPRKTPSRIDQRREQAYLDCRNRGYNNADCTALKLPLARLQNHEQL